MLEIIAPSGPETLWTSVLLLLVMGSAAAFATGRAIALTWRSPALIVLYAGLLAAALGFLDYALFENAIIPGARIVEALAQMGSAPSTAVFDLMGALAGFMMIFTVEAVVAFASFRATRAAQIARQYGFVFVRHGVFGWRRREHSAA